MHSRSRRFIGATVLVACAFGIASCQWSKHLQISLSGEEAFEDAFGNDSKLPNDRSMMALANDLDDIERHIDWYGSVVPKVPDVWGQARLTQHREQFEEQMKADLSKFEFTVNGALARSDQAFLTQAIALGEAAMRRTSSSNSTQMPVPAANVVILPELTTGTGTAITSTITQPTTPPTQPGSVAAITIPAYTTQSLSNRLPDTKIAIEPTLLLQQKERYLNLLNQIRRTNEGDDTADAPGYSLNLMRIPVSILPGKKTDVGFGAEITFSINPVLNPELLPVTFRNLVINDLVDHMGYPLTRFLSDPDSRGLLNENHRNKLKTAEDNLISNNAAFVRAQPPEQLPNPRTARLRQTDEYKAIREKFDEKPAVPALAPAKGVNFRTPLPNTQIVDVYGLRGCFEIAYQAKRAFEKEILNQGYAHMPDVQAFLQGEIGAAYRFLMDESNHDCWEFCNPKLVQMVRARDIEGLDDQREKFLKKFELFSQRGGKRSDGDVDAKNELTAILAWTIIVDSALLTDRLIQDMRESTASRGFVCPVEQLGWLDFYMPNPSAQARGAFNDYVRCRWPIHVFALDPETQDQNLADALTTRRDMQLALSMAFVRGSINANSFTRYARRLESTYETIALNRTQVGFSHGENTFGWRFYPRFQTPDTKSNMEVIVRDQLIGGPNRNALLRERRLEPGPRECVAIVLMPSFVPYLTCDSVSNWFALANPKHKALDNTQALKISKAIKSLQTCGSTVSDAECYRDGDHARLIRRVEQLEGRLPTQTMSVQVPVINTIGGFKMFNNGTTDLAPELYGFYGAPGVNLNQPTTLFLVGDHFSALQTKVIIGNKPCDTTMLSRQVVKVIVPIETNTDNEGFVHAHLATPYGVTRELHIPTTRMGKPERFELSKLDWTLQYNRKLAENQTDKYRFVAQKSFPQLLLVNYLASDAKPSKVRLEFKFAPRGIGTTILTEEKTLGPDGLYVINVESEIMPELLKAVNGDKPMFASTDSPWEGELKSTSIRVIVSQTESVPLSAP